MEFKNNLKKLMEENNLTLYKLNNICDLSINTLRKLVNDPSHNARVESLNTLAQVFDCSIKDLLEDDISIINYEKIAGELNNKALYSQQQVFSPENIEYLKQLLMQVGIACNISSYGYYRTASIKNEYELSSIQVDINIRVSEIRNNSLLHVVNFYSYVNQALLNEESIKDTLIRALETYARKLNFGGICFTIDQDFERQIDKYSNIHSEITADFTYTLGTQSSLFIQNNYERSSCPAFEKYQIEWRKELK